MSNGESYKAVKKELSNVISTKGKTSSLRDTSLDTMVFLMDISHNINPFYNSKYPKNTSKVDLFENLSPLGSIDAWQWYRMTLRWDNISFF